MLIITNVFNFFLRINNLTDENIFLFDIISINQYLNSIFYKRIHQKKYKFINLSLIHIIKLY